MQLAAKYGVTAKAVRDIWNLRTWAVRVMMCSCLTVLLDSTPRHPGVVSAVPPGFARVHTDSAAAPYCTHTVGDAPSLVAGGPREIPFQAPVRILQAPRREVASDGM